MKTLDWHFVEHMIDWKFGTESGQKRARGEILRKVFRKADRGGNRESAGRVPV